MDLTSILQERFKLNSFRPGQREAIETLLESGSLLCILPTGYGKSLLYQMPSLILDGLTIVISPLLALMRERRTASELDDNLNELVANHLRSFKARVEIDAVVALPSQTWASRSMVGQRVTKILKVPCFLDLLYWVEIPAKRQGELLNNDQRRDNVKFKMGARDLTQKNVLLVDDYVGSGATLKEAARALSEVKKRKIYPFTIAKVKWRLGEPGMI